MIQKQYNALVSVNGSVSVEEAFGVAGFHPMHVSPLPYECTRFGHQDVPGMVAFLHRDGDIHVTHFGCENSGRIIKTLRNLVA